jgi:uncharacterized membrane protein YvbJ
MIFCLKCGSPMDDNVKFCPKCGVQTAEAQQAQATDAQAKNKVMAILSYIIFFIPLLTGEQLRCCFSHTRVLTVLAYSPIDL